MYLVYQMYLLLSAATFDQALLEKIDDSAYHSFESRIEAIRWLLKFALSQNPKPKR